VCDLPGIKEIFLDKGKKEVFHRGNFLAQRLPPRVTPTLATPLLTESSRDGGHWIHPCCLLACSFALNWLPDSLLLLMTLIKEFYESVVVMSLFALG